MAAFPSKVTDFPWIYCPASPFATGNPDGKWMLFYARDELDDAWARALRRFHGGHLLGVHSMKVSTENTNDYY